MIDLCSIPVMTRITASRRKVNRFGQHPLKTNRLPALKRVIRVETLSQSAKRSFPRINAGAPTTNLDKYRLIAERVDPVECFCCPKRDLRGFSQCGRGAAPRLIRPRYAWANPGAPFLFLLTLLDTDSVGTSYL